MKRLPTAIAGLTLVELMVSITIGLLVTLAASALMLSSKRVHGAQDDAARMDEGGRYALEVITRAVRQAGYAGTGMAARSPGAADPAVLGLDAASVARNTPGIEAPSSSVNHSDLLALRYAGSGTDRGDGSILNCAGFPVPEHVGVAADGRGWSIFYVAADAGGEPQLYCKYPGRDGWAADAVVRGVEALQVLYGVDTDGDGLPERMLPAAALGAPTDDGAAVTWSHVVSVRVALLMRGTANDEDGVRVYDMFGSGYAERRDSADPGIRLDTAAFPPAVQKRVRKIFSTTIALRNHPAGAPQ